MKPVHINYRTEWKHQAVERQAWSHQIEIFHPINLYNLDNVIPGSVFKQMMGSSFFLPLQLEQLNAQHRSQDTPHDFIFRMNLPLKWAPFIRAENVSGVHLELKCL